MPIREVQHLRHHHNAGQRIGRRNPRPDAAHSASDYARWLSDEPEPRDLMRPFPAQPMRMWPISTRVNKPENDDPSIVEPIGLSDQQQKPRTLGASA
jgi:hypothetical protein